MKKLNKINLELNKEIISNLSNDNLNQVKGGASDINSRVTPCCNTPISVPDYKSCICLYTDECVVSVKIICIQTQQSTCSDTIPANTQGGASVCYCHITDNC